MKNNKKQQQNNKNIFINYMFYINIKYCHTLVYVSILQKSHKCKHFTPH